MITSVGHRGAAGLEPENTLKSFQRAIDLGVDAVECDVHLSADGHVIVAHDPTVDRTCNGCGAIAEMTLDEICRLDAGDGRPPPRLEELLDFLRGRCGLYCELKADGTASPAATAVRERGMTGEVVFISFYPELLGEVHEVLPSARTSLLFGRERFEEIAPGARRARVEMIGVHHRFLCLDTMVQARQAGWSVAVWTPNTAEEISAMVALGVSSITSDYPDRLMEVLRAAAP